MLVQYTYAYAAPACVKFKPMLANLAPLCCLDAIEQHTLRLQNLGRAGQHNAGRHVS